MRGFTPSSDLAHLLSTWPATLDDETEMKAREIEDAGREVAALRQIAFVQLALSFAAALAASLTVEVDGRLAVAFGAGAGVEALLAVASTARRRALVASLALRREAYLIPEVRRYGEELTAASTRRAFARSIASVLRATAADSPGVYLADRVVLRAPALAGLARVLLEPGNVVDPTAMAACKQLLTDGGTSPLLNPALAPTELDAVLRRIHGGIYPRSGRE